MTREEGAFAMKEIDVLCVGMCCLDVLIRGVDLHSPFTLSLIHI